MKPISISVLTICGIDELSDARDTPISHVLSMLDPGRADPPVLSAYAPHQRTLLRFHDIIATAPGRVMPQPEHVDAILTFGSRFRAQQDPEAPSHLLVHCHMGVSRSTAAMLSLMAQANPDESGESLFARLVAIRPQAWPNSQMIGFADEQLGRKGDLKAALARHYARQIKERPDFVEWMTRLGRQAELEMAAPE